MNPTKLKLTNPTADELSAAVAEHVDGWTDAEIKVTGTGVFYGQTDVPPYSISADAVLPLLEKAKERGLWVQIKDHTNGIDCGQRDWLVIVTNYDDCCDPDMGDPGYPDQGKLRYFEGASPVLARAISIALCKEAGIEVEITPQPAQK